MVERSKNNLVLIAGILLPLLLVLLLLVSTALPKLFVAPPKYDFVFTAQEYVANPLDHSNEVEVRDGKVVLHVEPAKDPKNAPVTQKLRIFFYDAKNDSTRELSVSELENLRVDASIRAPDGYAVLYPEYQYSDGFSSFFFSSYSRTAYAFVLKKDGNAVKIPASDPTLSNYKFRAWILSK